MEANVTQLIKKLRQGAVDRCRERVLRAAEKTKYNNKNQIEKITAERTIAAHLKTRRGL